MQNPEDFARELKDKFEELIKDHTKGVSVSVLAAECALLTMVVVKEQIHEFYGDIVKIVKEKKPIHKLNGGIGATVCNKCYVIISEGYTDDLYCEKCKTRAND